MKYIATLIFCFVFVSLSHTQTTISEGEVSGSWKKSLSPYQVTGNIHIPNGLTLFIEPGVKVEFQGHYQLKVEGSLRAEGTISDTILFTASDTSGFSSPDTSLGGWYGIRIYDNDPGNDSTKLAFCRLEYGKAIGPGWFLNAGGAFCVIDCDKVSVSHCLFTNNMSGGPDEFLPAGGAVHLAWSDVSFSHNTFRNNYSYAGGAIQFHESKPVFKNNLFINNRCMWDGGAISGGGSSPSFYGDVFRENHSDELGGALHFGGCSNMLLDNISVSGNEARWAGGVGFQGCIAEIRNSNISNNLAVSFGGGMAADGSSIIISNSAFERDSCGWAAGGIHTWQGTLKLEGVSFSENVAQLGGAVHSDWSTLILEGSNFSHNTATEVGGALKVFNSHMLMDSCNIEDNISLVDAGAIDYAADTLVYDSLFVVKIQNTRISNNSAGRAAGGMSIQQTHARHAMLNLSIDHCEIADNRARQVAGFRIIRCLNKLNLSNSLIRGNRADAWTGGASISSASLGRVFNCVFFDNQSALVNSGSTSGGLSSSNGTKLDVINCTFVGNSAGAGGGLTAYRGGEASATNCLFWNNTPDQLALISVFDSLPCRITLNYNDIQNGPDSILIRDTVSILDFGMGNVDRDPFFVDPVQGDFHLRENSPLIGAGIDSLELGGISIYAPLTDIEGFPRPNPSGSKPDMGAFENSHAGPVGIDLNPKKPLVFEARAYPNPFRESISFEFNLPVQSMVSLEVFNLLGMQIDIFRSRDMMPGKHLHTWATSQTNGAIYFYRIRVVTQSNQVYIKTGRVIQLD